MALSTESIELPFTTGPDTKHDPKLVDGQKFLLSLVNGTFDGTGRLLKRPGHASLITQQANGTAFVSGGKTLFKRGDELLTLNTDYTSGQIFSRVGDKLTPRGYARTMVLESLEHRVSNGRNRWLDYDFYSDGTYDVLLYSEHDGQNPTDTVSLYLQINRVDNGSMVSRTALVSGATAGTIWNPKIVASSASALGVFYMNLTLRFRTVALSDNPTVGGETALTAFNIAKHDVCARNDAGGAGFFAVYYDGTNWLASTLNAAGVIQNTFTMTAGSIGVNPQGMGAVVCQSTGIYVFVVSEAVTGLNWVKLTVNASSVIAFGARTIADALAIGARLPHKVGAVVSPGGGTAVAYETDGGVTVGASADGGGVYTLVLRFNGTVETTAALWAPNLGGNTVAAPTADNDTGAESVKVANGGYLAYATGCQMTLAGVPFYVDGFLIVPCVLHSVSQSAFYLIRGAYRSDLRMLIGTAAAVGENDTAATTQRPYDPRSDNLAQMRVPGTWIETASTGGAHTRYRVSTPHSGPLELGGFLAGTSRSFTKNKISVAVINSLSNTLYTGNIASAESGGAAFLSGGCPSEYDGEVPFEQGFHHYPERVTYVSAVVGAGTAIPAGTYQMVAVYAWVDAQGRKHRSAPSLPYSMVVPVGGVDSVVVAVPTLRLTDRSNVLIELYVTQVDGTIFYRYVSYTSDLAIKNNPAVPTVSFTWNSTATASRGEVLYTTGGALENIPLPPCSYIVEHQRRVFGVSREADEVVFTDEPRTGFAHAHGDDYRIVVPLPEGGPITALASLDDKLVVFRERKILIQMGEGPNQLGTDSTFLRPRALPGDIGCVDPESVCKIPGGVLFRSENGFFLLSPSMTLTYIGAPVEGLVDDDEFKVARSVVMPAQNHVRICCIDGTILVYFYEFDLWSKWANTANASLLAFKDACEQDGSFLGLQASGQIVTDTPDSYLDAGAGTYYNMTVDTAWFKLGGLLGYQRLRWVSFLAEGSPNLSAAVQMAVGVYYDYSSVSSETVYSSAIFGGSLTIRHKPGQQKCSAVRFRFVESGLNGSGNEAGFIYTALRLDYGVKPGTNKKATGI